MMLLRTLLKFIAWPMRLLLLLLLAILASLNLHDSTVFLFLGHQVRAPMAVLLLITFTSGAVLGVLGLTLSRLRASRRKNAEATAKAASPLSATATPEASHGAAAVASQTLQP